MKLFYSRSADAAPKGTKFRNVRFYEAPEPKAATVYIDGDFPKIEADYASLGALVVRVDKIAPAFVPADLGDDVILVPGDWRTLPWTQPDERQMTLRGLASQVSDVPVRTKDEAVQAIEAYLSGELDRPLDGAGGLSRRELNASLEGLNLEIVPNEDPAETFQRIEGARASRDVAADLERDPS